MIYSTTICPLCHTNLIKREEFIYSDVASTFYFCPTQTISVLNWLYSKTDSPHYLYRVNSQTAHMIFPPFAIEHILTISIILAISPTQSPKVLLEIPLLDIDYSQPNIQDQLQTYLVFS